MIILGGIDYKEIGLNDGWILDSQTDTLKQVMRPYLNSLKLSSKCNQSYMFGQNKIIAKVHVHLS